MSKPIKPPLHLGHLIAVGALAGSAILAHAFVTALAASYDWAGEEASRDMTRWFASMGWITALALFCTYVITKYISKCQKRQAENLAELRRSIRYASVADGAERYLEEH